MLTILADALLLSLGIQPVPRRQRPPRHADNPGHTEPWADRPRWEAPRHWLR